MRVEGGAASTGRQDNNPAATRRPVWRNVAAGLLPADSGKPLTENGGTGWAASTGRRDPIPPLRGRRQAAGRIVRHGVTDLRLNAGRGRGCPCYLDGVGNRPQAGCRRTVSIERAGGRMPEASVRRDGTGSPDPRVGLPQLAGGIPGSACPPGNPAATRRPVWRNAAAGLLPADSGKPLTENGGTGWAASTGRRDPIPPLRGRRQAAGRIVRHGVTDLRLNAGRGRGCPCYLDGVGNRPQAGCRRTVSIERAGGRMPEASVRRDGTGSPDPRVGPPQLAGGIPGSACPPGNPAATRRPVWRNAAGG
jgi:hypothetical protein